MIFRDAKCLLAVNIKNLAIILGKWNGLFMLVVLVGYDDNESFVLFAVVDSNLGINTALGFGSSEAQEESYYK